MVGSGPQVRGGADHVHPSIYSSAYTEKGSGGQLPETTRANFGAEGGQHPELVALRDEQLFASH